MNHRRQSIRAGAVISYITIALNLLTGLFYIPWLIRRMGSSDYAIYTIVISVMTYFVMDLGIGATISRFAARYVVRGEKEKVDNLLGITLKIYMVLDFIIFAGLVMVYFLLEFIYVKLTLPELERLKTVYLVMAAMTLCSTPFLPMSGIFTAYERLAAMKLFDLAGKIITVALVVTAVWLGQGLYLVVVINAAVTIMLNFIKFFYIREKTGIRINLRFEDSSLLRQLLGFSAWVMAAMVADRFFFSAVPTLLGVVSNSMQIAVFAVGASVEGYILTFANALNGLFLPRVTRMMVEGRSREEITDLMIRVGRIQLAVVSFFIISMLIFGREFITIWYGTEYAGAYPILVLILIPCFIHLTQGIAMEAVYAAGQVRYRAIANGAGSLICIILTLALGSRWGAAGAGLGISAGFIIGYEIIMNIVYKKKLKLNIGRFFRKCHLAMMPGLILCAGGGMILHTFFAPATMLGFIVKYCLWGLIYIPVVWLTVLNGSEKAMAAAMIMRKSPPQ